MTYLIRLAKATASGLSGAVNKPATGEGSQVVGSAYTHTGRTPGPGIAHTGGTKPFRSLDMSLSLGPSYGSTRCTSKCFRLYPHGLNTVPVPLSFASVEYPPRLFSTYNHLITTGSYARFPPQFVVSHSFYQRSLHSHTVARSLAAPFARSFSLHSTFISCNIYNQREHFLSSHYPNGKSSI